MKTCFKLVLLMFLSMFMVGNEAHANLYARPRAGMAVPLNGGDPYYSLGGTLGYQWLSFFATEATYLRLLGYDTAPNGHSIRGQGVLSAPTGIIKPYATLGVGWFNLELPGNDDSEVMTILGGGLSLSKIAFLTASVGLEYAIIPDKPDLIEPYAAIGIAF